MKNIDNIDLVIGKRIREVHEIFFGTYYPVVSRDDIENPDAVIIGVVCAEDGSGSGEYHWHTDGDVAWYVGRDCDDVNACKHNIG